eukprot:TRINITY_DN15265_c0_g1_i1.p1 TRINITY_DN15265_c0_g1~~TRINITY_DN15265_c0_g1_i1.p1  ORF type:complete len:398 (+),score=70.55 TRINITY_DN15265_c0_g1_i1:66-1259(+)
MSGGRLPGIIQQVEAHQQDTRAAKQALEQLLPNLGSIPRWFETHQPCERVDCPAVIYTDLEPDDIFAIACIRFDRDFPICIFSVDRSSPWGKDEGGIYAKKLVMATAALGREFLHNLFILDGTEADVRVVADIHAKVKVEETKYSGRPSEWYIMAPGRGRLRSLLDQVPKTSVRIYSGSFNTRAPNMTPEDLVAIAAIAEPIRDSAAFVFSGGAPEFRSLLSVWPSMEADIQQINSVFIEAWHIFCADFDGRLVGATHPKLFAGPLTEDEKAHFDSLVGPLYPGKIQEYCEALRTSPYFSKVTGFKQSTVYSLASGCLDGPLCDVLISLGEVMHGQGHTEETTGRWSCDNQSGHTKISKEGPCNGSSLKLLDPAAARPAFEAELRNRVLQALAATRE